MLVCLSVCAVLCCLSLCLSVPLRRDQTPDLSIHQPINPPHPPPHTYPHQNHLNASDRPAPEILARITTRHRTSEPQESQHPLQQHPSTRPSRDYHVRYESTRYFARYLTFPYGAHPHVSTCPPVALVPRSSRLPPPGYPVLATCPTGSLLSTPIPLSPSPSCSFLTEHHSPVRPVPPKSPRAWARPPKVHQVPTASTYRVPYPPVPVPPSLPPLPSFLSSP